MANAVWHCKSKPNYGMRDLDSVLEERYANKLELTGALIDAYQEAIGRGFFFCKMGRSKCTGHMPPFKMFIPCTIFQNVYIICVPEISRIN